MLISNTARAHFGERIEFDETQLCSSERAEKNGVACDLDQRMFFSLEENLSVIDVTLTETVLTVITTLQEDNLTTVTTRTAEIQSMETHTP